MRRKSLLFCAIFTLCALSAGAQGVSSVWVADQGNGTYRNPILHADYSDPDIIRVGDDYWMTSSSFDCLPALQILHSTDLVNWQLAGAVRSYRPKGVQEQHGNGVWAPSIRHHNGRYYIYWGDPDVGIYMVESEDPRGEWSEPHLVEAGVGMIDPCPLWDDDGKAYLVHSWAGSRAGFKSILSASEMAPDGKSLIGPDVLIYDGHAENPTIEGPKFYKRNGWYYIFAPAGGVKEGWQLVMRSREPLGKYEWRKVLHQGNTSIHGPHQGGWVTDAAGDSWFVHFEDRYAYGRVVHLQPMEWQSDGWCTMGVDTNNDGIGEPVTTYRKPYTTRPMKPTTPSEGDEFTSPALGLQWQWFGNPERSWAMVSPEGYLRLYCKPYTNLWEAKNILSQKITAPREVVTAKVRFTAGVDGDRAGLIIHGRDIATLAFVHKDGKLMLRQTECYGAEKGAEEVIVGEMEWENGKELLLRVEISDGAMCSFSIAESGKAFRTIGKPFRAKEGKWIGAKFGLFAVTTGKTNDGGRMDVDWVRVTK
ncbi:MAG: glycoside hydrolase 43 family protein [Tidjanibacter sp.]|nr:glycoside hydrolase 43 family protein [Tidjanibacter sp.]